MSNVAGHLCSAKEPVRRRTYGMFRRVDMELGSRVETATEKLASSSSSSSQKHTVSGAQTLEEGVL